MTKKEERIYEEHLLKAIKNALELLGNYKSFPKTRDSYLANYSYFDDRIFPLTNLAVEQYKRLVKVRNSKIAEHLVKNNIKKNDFRKMKNNPNGTLLFKAKPEGRKRATIRRITHREWWTIGAAGALCNMLNRCSVYIKWLNNNPDTTRNQRATAQIKLYLHGTRTM